MARLAGPRDVEELASLYESALNGLLAQRGGALFGAEFALEEPVAETLARLIEDPTCCVVVGAYNNAVVGLALVHVAEPRHGEGSDQGIVRVFYVDSGARNVGVGEAMLNEVVAWCESRGCVGLSVPVPPGAREAKSFFEEMAFRARLLVMHRDLGTQ
jgi:GNAT superfamily N-acetyltransferase